MNYIGMDTHISTLDFAVVNEAGRLTKRKSIATSAKGFTEFVKQVPAPRTIQNSPLLLELDSYVKKCLYIIGAITIKLWINGVVK